MGADDIVDLKNGKIIVPVSELDENAPDYLQKLEDGFEASREVTYTIGKSIESLESELVKILERASELVGKLGVEKVLHASDEEIKSFPSEVQNLENSVKELQSDAKTLDLDFKVAAARLDEYGNAILGLTEIKPLFSINKDYSEGVLIVYGKDGLDRVNMDFFMTKLPERTILSEDSVQSLTFKQLSELKSETRQKNVWEVKNPSRKIGSVMMAEYAIVKLQDWYENEHPEDLEIIDNFKKMHGELEARSRVLDMVSEVLGATNMGNLNKIEEDIVRRRGVDYYAKKCPTCPGKNSCPQREVAKKVYNQDF
jgi:archaellum component FlaC